MKIFITGAEGFIGSHLTEKLVKNGHEVKAFVLYNFGNSNGWLDRLDIKIRKRLNTLFLESRWLCWLWNIGKHSPR